MTNGNPEKWLLLIHQIPPHPNALRVRIWRRLHQVGAVAIKQSVYVLPFSDSSREDLSWILKEIVEGGGNGSISTVRFLEGLTNEQVIGLFHAARKPDYEKIIQEADHLLSQLTAGEKNLQEPGMAGGTQVSKLQRRFEEIKSIDFFPTSELRTAEIRLKKLAACLSGAPVSAPKTKKDLSSLQGKVWVTRKNLFVDRIACGWFIRRFIDNQATLKFISGSRYTPQAGELRFDMFEGEFTHQGDRCTLEVMIQTLGLQDQALASLAEIVHDIDLKDQKYRRSETDGFRALLTGLVTSRQDDRQRLEEGSRLFESLYTYFGYKKRNLAPTIKEAPS